jgi:hypothetical protein
MTDGGRGTSAGANRPIARRRVTDDPVVAAQLAQLFRRGVARHHARQAAGQPEPPRIAAEREEIAAMLAAHRAARGRQEKPGKSSQPGSDAA